MRKQMDVDTYTLSLECYHISKKEQERSPQLEPIYN